jgi:hypothetical protein
MVPPSHGWFDVRSERRGSGSAVGDRADSVRERAVGERTKSTTGQYAAQPTRPVWAALTYLDCPAHSMPPLPVAHRGRPC